VRGLTNRAADVRAVAVEIERQIRVPDEIVRADEAARRSEVGGGHKVEDQSAERRIERAASVRRLDEPVAVYSKRARSVLHPYVSVGDARIEHSHRNLRSRRRLNVPCALEIDVRKVPLQMIEGVVRHKFGMH